MKNPTLTAPILITAALASLALSGTGCGPGSSADSSHPTNSPATATTQNSAASTNPASASAAISTNATPLAATNAADTASATTNIPSPVLASADASNSATSGPATPEAAPTLPETNTPVRVVEMPTTTPEAPKNFFPQEIETNQPVASTASDDYSMRLRAGYEHTYHGDNNDTWYAGLKFYAYPDHLRARAGKNAWLIPDADLEFSHQDLAKPDITGHPGSAQGLNLRGSFTWPWFHWTTAAFVRENCPCPYSQPLTFTLGPTANFGFDYLFEDNNARFARYFGARLSVNRLAFIEYTAGATDGLDGTRQQILTEIPFYITHDQQVHYVFRGLWNHGNTTPDVLQAGLFLEMPLGVFTHPREWADLIPFVQ